MNTFINIISNAIKNTEDMAKIYSQYFEVPNTTKDRQDISCFTSNLFPPHLTKFLKKNEIMSECNDGYKTAKINSKIYAKWTNGQECVYNGKTNKCIHGKEVKRLHWPTSFISWWELKVNPEDVKEVYLHKSSMCLVIKLKSGRKIGIQSVSFSRIPQRK